MKLLYITTIGKTMGFFVNLLESLLAEGHTIDIACNTAGAPVPECYIEWGCKVFPLSCTRSALDKKNFTAVKEIRKIVAEGNYDLVHCHTPIAAACTRVACRPLRKKGLKVFYTAHGFHFYKGAPLKNWLLYYPVEWICSWWTDVLITINTEDFQRAKKHLHAKKTEYVPGVGIDLTKFQCRHANNVGVRSEIGISATDMLMLSVGELNENKNHSIVIRALATLKNSKIHYCIAGVGDMKEELLFLARKLGIENQVHLLGYRNDVPELMQCADVFVLPSIREGLNVSLMEAMASGLPCICSDIRGNRDLIEEEKGGYRVLPLDVKCWADSIRKIELKKTETINYGVFNQNKIKKFANIEIFKELKRIYQI